MTYRFETLQQHGGQKPDSATGSRAVPLYQTTSYVFQDTEDARKLFASEKEGYIYSRLGNPTVAVFEERMALLEGGTHAVALASGSAAVAYAIMNVAVAGDEIISASTLYGGTYNLLASTLVPYGITTHFVNPDDPQNFAAQINERTKAIYLETLGNPAINIPDFDAIAAIAHEAGIPVIVDNTFATPYLFRPFEHGADVVVHSATKLIGGHGTSLGGVIVENGKFDWTNGRFPAFDCADAACHNVNFARDIPGGGFTERVRGKFLRDLGACLSPFNAWLLLLGLETLSLRVERHVANTRALVRFLGKHPGIEQVNYPEQEGSAYCELAKKYFPRGCGSIFSVDVRGGYDNARRLIDNLRVFSHLANVGDSKSLVVHPASTTHQQLDEAAQKAAGIGQGTVRISVGLENVEDLIEDMSHSLDKLEF